jgi:pantoate--beta-alanine ligase
MTHVYSQLKDWQSFRSSDAVRGKTLGFVPTMGALHPGHRSLVEKSVAENDLTVVSIFVNPTQFNDPKDLEKYPRTFEKDLELLKQAGASFVLSPTKDSLYPDDYRYKVTENTFSTELCGAHRPGHFDGVLSVVLKLLNIARADRAYFGEKDFQQLSLIRGMAEAFFLPTEIIACPTVRESDGLAMSSRNTLLTAEERRHATLFPQILGDTSLTEQEARKKLAENGFIVDYVTETRGRRFGAVKLGSVRLIDNFELRGDSRSL